MSSSLQVLSKQVSGIIDKQDFFNRKNLSLKEPPYNYILSKLDVEEQRIIYSEYIDNLDKDWYKQYYSRATYYRYKRSALENFLELYERL